MKSLAGAKVFKRVMIHTVGHHRGAGYHSTSTLVFWRSPARDQMPVYPSAPWSNGLGQSKSLCAKGILSLKRE